MWFTRSADRCYLVAETGEHAQWVRNVRKDPRVLWGDGLIVELRPGPTRRARR